MIWLCAVEVFQLNCALSSFEFVFLVMDSFFKTEGLISYIFILLFRDLSLLNTIEYIFEYSFNVKSAFSLKRKAV